MSKQEDVLEDLQAYLQENGLNIVEKKEIAYGEQVKITNGTEVAIVNVYTTGKVNVGGKKTALKAQLTEWSNLQQAGFRGKTQVKNGIQGENRTSKYVVALAKITDIREWLQSFSEEITLYKGAEDSSSFYRAELRHKGEKVVLTQYRTGTLLVQGKTGLLFDDVCERLDNKLSQSIPERAARYIPEQAREQALEVMTRPDSEDEALNWVQEELNEDIYNFLYPHDQQTLLSGAALIKAVEKINLKLQDYSVLVMPFGRAYEGFLMKLFIHLGIADEVEVREDASKIKIGKWLGDLPDLIVDSYRHGHLCEDLKTAWSGTRNFLLHSDPARDVKMSSLEIAEREIGVVIRAMLRGHESFVRKPIELSTLTESTENDQKPKEEPAQKQSRDMIEIENIDEAALLARLEEAEYKVEHYDDPKKSTKWRLITEGWKVFCPREPGDKIIVRGKQKEAFVEWYHGENAVEVTTSASAPALIAHIGVDEAGKGDYFGPLVVGAVYITPETALELAKFGVRDSKTLSDTTIADLALKIQELCPHYVIIQMPSEYNEAYARHNNLNSLLAELHAKAMAVLVDKTGCTRVIDDQFAAPHVLEGAIAEQNLDIILEQHPGGESDIAVAAASILAREAFVSTIEDFRRKSGLQIPLGSSSPKVIEIGRTVVQRWGKKGLRRIAKLNFKITQDI